MSNGCCPRRRPFCYRRGRQRTPLQHTNLAAKLTDRYVDIGIMLPSMILCRLVFPWHFSCIAELPRKTHSNNTSNAKDPATRFFLHGISLFHQSSSLSYIWLPIFSECFIFEAKRQFKLLKRDRVHFDLEDIRGKKN